MSTEKSRVRFSVFSGGSHNNLFSTAAKLASEFGRENLISISVFHGHEVDEPAEDSRTEVVVWYWEDY